MNVRVLKKYVNDCRIIHENKLRRLGCSTYNNPNVVLNLTDRILTDAEVKILSRGLQFSITLKSVNTLNIRTELEAFYYKISRNNLTCEQQTKIKQSLHAIDRNYDNKRTKTLHSNITKVEHDALIKLSKNQSIVVVKSDKTNQAVIMNKNDYIEKSMKILGNAKKFKKLDKDPTRTRENRLNAMLLKMKKEGEITDKQYQTMR